jgi:hypothetical protein
MAAMRDDLLILGDGWLPSLLAVFSPGPPHAPGRVARWRLVALSRPFSDDGRIAAKKY